MVERTGPSFPILLGMCHTYGVLNCPAIAGFLNPEGAFDIDAGRQAWDQSQKGPYAKTARGKSLKNGVFDNRV